jgi:Na+/phosphate symporter
LNNQYSVLLKELFRKTNAKETISREFIDALKDKNITMQDVINVSRHLDGILPSTSFIEGWQNTEPTTLKKSNEGFSQRLKEDFQTLSGSSSYLDIQKRLVQVSEEKNNVAYNYLGLYGFLNLVAIGLLIFIAAGPTKRGD